MPPNTFEAEIFSFPHTYTKLTFGTAGIKKLDKVKTNYICLFDYLFISS